MLVKVIAMKCKRQKSVIKTKVMTWDVFFFIPKVFPPKKNLICKDICVIFRYATFKFKHILGNFYFYLIIHRNSTQPTLS